MFNCIFKYIGYLFIALVMVVPSLALAAAEDPGISIGSGKLHPYYQLEPHFATNPSRSSNSRLNDLEILNRLGLAFDVPSEKLEFNADLSGNYDWYLGLQNPATKNYSDWGLDLDMGFKILKKKKISANINEIFSRSANAYNPVITSGLSLISNTTGLDLIMKPGGGALQFVLSYKFMLYWYMADGYDPSALQNMRHNISFLTSWHFLPKTALNLSISTTPTIYPGGAGGALNNSSGATYPGLSSYENPNSLPFSATIGLNGLFTNHLTFNVNVGYGAVFNLKKGEKDKSDNLHTVVGRAEMKWVISETGTLSFGYVRDVGPTSLYRFYDKHEGFLKYSHLLFNRRMTASTKVAYDFYRFGTPLVENPYSSSDTPRRDGALAVEASIGYNCRKIFSIALVDNLELRHSKYISFAGTPIGYVTNNLFLRLEVRY